ncbi:MULTISPECIES: GMC family oxidoreductase N-terminal domain-containing protein [unclassified Microbacterium]|uniref:GMC family oxidoreductase n=1 Tax=unclassified Microbacterium TaxID=2609290 RepID=UPI00214B436F|nr:MULTISPECIES: GMC family oxidoreductase N-terminal domain-containing protein [unclassified Microbacterium]MCR2811240.1 GMC family oxidoreductase N-terminal domain-containing protein [Microbacterium sp. zg.B185]WIM19839.1 GMC family oxidoreductase N-terminal domain-containing protein [Microbacterium sp. zg-B185]
MTARRIVVVGAGGSGIPLAARLGAAGRDVMLVEAGQRGEGTPGEDATFAQVRADVRSVRAGLPDEPTAWTYATELTPGRAYRVGRGRTLGGSSAVNGGYFLRAHPDDFAGWAAVAGPEWSWAACLGALRRLESDHDFPADPVHGAHGPVPVVRDAGTDPVTASFMAGAVQHGAVLEADKNGGGASGVGTLPCNALGGQRWGTDRAYGDVLAEAAVQIRGGLDVRRVLWQGSRAVGVEAVGAEGTVRIEADEVVLCAGAIETPRLLMRSGVGPRASHPLHGVGRGLSDHAAVSVSWRARSGSLPSAPMTAWTAAWNTPAGSLAAHPLELLLPVLPTAALVSGDLTLDGPLDLRVALSTPLSRGSVHAGGDGVDIHYGYLSAESERHALREGVRAALAVLGRGPMAEVVETVELVERLGAAPTDAQLDEWIRANLATALHSTGTARMGPADDPDAVVDAHGRVHGVEGLRVADASILPAVPSRGTSNTAVMVGERIAELMGSETGPRRGSGSVARAADR